MSSMTSPSISSLPPRPGPADRSGRRTADRGAGRRQAGAGPRSWRLFVQLGQPSASIELGYDETVQEDLKLAETTIEAQRQLAAANKIAPQ